MHGQAMRTVRVSGGSDETPQLKREDSKQVHLWLLFSSVVFCFLTFSSLFIARKSADCFHKNKQMYVLFLPFLFYLPQRRQNLFFCAGTFWQCLHTSTQGRSGPQSCAGLRSFLLGGCSTAQGTSPCGKAVLLSQVTSQEIPLRRCYFIC